MKGVFYFAGLSGAQILRKAPCSSSELRTSETPPRARRRRCDGIAAGDRRSAPRPGRAREANGFDQLAHPPPAQAPRPSCGRTPPVAAGEEVFQVHVLDQEERAGAELIGEATGRRRDVVDWR